MNDALPTATVTEYEGHIRDVMIVMSSQQESRPALLTWNLRHFPESELRRFGLRKMTPDAFLSRLFADIPDLVIGSLANARRNLSKSRIPASDFVAILRDQKLVQLAGQVEKHASDL